MLIINFFIKKLCWPGHYLGMDVHDSSMISYSRPLEPGAVSSLPDWTTIRLSLRWRYCIFLAYCGWNGDTLIFAHPFWVGWVCTICFVCLFKVCVCVLFFIFIYIFVLGAQDNFLSIGTQRKLFIKMEKKKKGFRPFSFLGYISLQRKKKRKENTFY